MRRKIVVSGLIIVSTLILAGLRAGAAWRGEASAQVRQAPQEQDVLPALLTEVRGLRAAMEEMASAGPRVQLALGRLQLQEQRVNNVLRRLETVRGSLVENQNNYERFQQQVTQLEDAAPNQQTGHPTAAELKEEQTQVKAMSMRAAAEVQRLTVEEAALSAELASEQGRWTDLNQRMEELERALTRR
jgi:chromosome segregation ATPase